MTNTNQKLLHTGALALCPAGFIMAALVVTAGMLLGASLGLFAFILFCIFQAGALTLGILTRTQHLGLAAAIAPGLSLVGAVMFAAISILVSFLPEKGRVDANEFSRSAAQSAFECTPGPAPTAATANTPRVTSNTRGRTVVINSARISVPQLEQLEQIYGMRIPDGDYWYDRVSGAWGFRGGAVEGRVLPGLQLGGQLRRDASNGHTGVVVNGREIHPLELSALQQLGPVYAGRYWLDARGNYGFEGGPMLGNLWSSGSPAGGTRKESALTSWDRTGVAVYGY